MSDLSLRDLLELALDTSVEGRRALAESIGDLFFERATVLTDHERALMSDILRKLILDCEMAVRRDLSERMSQMDSPPHELLVTLANDEIEVARPILMQCTLLHDMELIGIVRHRTQQHQLAIAMRSSLSEPVSDALVETGDADVIKALLENQDAKISEATMAYLAAESRRVDSYQEPLIKRKDLGPDLAARLYLWVSAALRRYILDNFEVDPVALDEQLEQIPQAIASDPEQHHADPRGEQPATLLAQRLVSEGQVTWEMLIQTLRQGEVALFEALFAALSGLGPARVRIVLYESGGEGLAIACRALDMPKPAFATIYLLARRGRPDTHTIGADELSRALTLFGTVKTDHAKTVLEGWRRGDQYQDAVETIAAAAKTAKTD